MQGKRLGIVHLVSAIERGEAIDWSALEAVETVETRREELRQLQALAEILAAHREWSSGAEVPRLIEPVTTPEAPLGSWGHLTLLESIGRGAFGEVFRAWDSRLDREVALKLLIDRDHAPASAPVVIEEGRLLARVRHPNVVTVYGAERIDGKVGVWMELVRGRTLDAILRERGRLGPTETVAIGLDICRALSAVHQAGLLHRDIKLRNVIQENGGRIVLMDFGAGREVGPSPAAGESDLSGTLHYMAPELLKGQSASRQSDIYSLGVLLFRLLTGHYPVAASSVDVLRLAYRNDERQWLSDLRPDLPASVTDVVERAIAADPHRRFETAGSFERALADTLTSASAPELPTNIARTHAPRSRADGVRPSSLGLRVAVAFLVLVVIASGLWIVGRQLMGRDSPITSSEGGPSLAVLPLANLTGDPAEEYFADGMTDALIGSLARNSQLRVVSRASSSQFKDGGKPLAEVARLLRVQAVVEGSVRRFGDRVRIDTRLVDARTDKHLWSETYERAISDVTSLHAEVAAAVSAALGSRLEVGESASEAQTRNVEPEAYEAYLKGRWHWNKRNAAGFKEALQYFDQSIGVDPTFAPAYAGLTDTYALLGMFGLMPAREAVPKARAAAERALQLDPELFEPHTSVAFLDLYEWNWSSAERGFKQAIALNPNYATAHHWYALHLVSLARYEEAEAAIQRAMEIDPLSLIITNDAGVIRVWKRDFAGAEQQFQGILAIDPNFAEAKTQLGWAEVYSGRAAQAVTTFEHALRLNQDNAVWLGSLAYAYAAAGRLDDARKLAMLLEDRSSREYVAPLALSLAYAALRDTDRAFAWMEKAYVERADWLTGLLHPGWDPIRHDPRFADLMRRVGYPPEVVPVAGSSPTGS